MNVGDIIYESTGLGLRRIKIDKVTKKYAMAGRLRFSQQVAEDGEVFFSSKKATGQYIRPEFYLATPELDKKYKRVQMINKIKAQSLFELSYEQLEGICKIIGE